MNQQEAEATGIIVRLRNEGHTAYFCGGYVRDRLLNRPNEDIDIATSATPDEVEALFGSDRTIQCGKNFLVCRVRYDKIHTEVATYRVDGDYKDGRHPATVSKGTLEEDAQRRDLTINALYYDPIEDKYLDPTGQGMSDIGARKVSFVGDPVNRIREDFIRILRAIRFASLPDFSMNRLAIQAILDNVELLLSTPEEAVKEELNKGFTSKSIEVDGYFESLYAMNVFKTLIPELHDLYGCEQTPKHHPEGDVFQHVKLMLVNARKEYGELSVPLVWSILMHDIAKPHTKAIDSITGYITNHGHAEKGEPIAQRIMEGLRFDNNTIDAVCYGVRNHMKFCQAKKMRKHKLIRLLKHEYGPLLMRLHWVDCVSSNGCMDSFAYANKVLEEAPQLQSAKPNKLRGPINGNDLLEMGYVRGIFLGQVLRDITDQYLDGEIISKEQALEYAREQFGKQEACTSP